MGSHSSLALWRVLADGAFHSGAALGAQFNMTRAGVHHHIGLLREMGAPVEGVRNKGYHLSGETSILDETGLIIALPEIDIHFHDTVPSTQDVLLPIARQKPVRPVLCVTEYQTQGRGRGDKSWDAPLGQGLCFSLCIVLNKPMQALSGFTLAMGVALREALAEMGATGLQLKWPNDIYHVSGKKLAGILTEVFGEMEGPTTVVIGVGLNVHASPDTPWWALQSCMSGLVTRQTVLIQIVRALLLACERYEHEGFEPFRVLYAKHDYLQGKTVTVQYQDQTVVTTVKGIGEAGELLINSTPYSLYTASILC